MRVNIFERIKIFLAAVCLGTVLFLFFCVYEIAPKNYLTVSFLDVGQGDAILFQTPDGGKILVDGGPDKKVLSELGRTLLLFDKKIDLVIATHDDADHIAGLVYVLKKYDVKVLLYSLPKSKSELSVELLKIAAQKNVKVVQVDRPLDIETTDNLKIKILFPVKNMDEAESNEASVVSQFIFGDTKFLLTGDLGQMGEIFLVNNYGDQLKSDVLKLGHHGSDTSTNPNFLQKVSPEVAIVSAGKNNSFGHPHKSVIDLVEKFGIKILRTDQDGKITLYSNGVNIWR